MSTFAQYESARKLAEDFAETVPGTQVLAVRDLDEDGGETILIGYQGQEYELALTFDELSAALGNPANKQGLFARWSDALATETPVAEDVPVTRSKAKK